ncbi:MAG: hypothetical protein A2Y81_10580 [Nitrospirae bacterium RBG_13_43_8]|nr:MAG: hypothetical protein A2Y81_10580 [Nitrospirae bacterium RBG_13_43_8]
MLCNKAATINYWNENAKWFKLWIEHNHYHNRIIEVLTTFVQPGWKVLDIGAGNGVLSLPLCAIGCEVTALEPSQGMRKLLYDEAVRRGIDWIKVEDKKLEDIEPDHFKDYDLIIASNSLHLTGIGFHESLQKISENNPKNVFLVAEHCPEIRVKWLCDEYTLLFAQCHQTESSSVYHHIDEVFEHYSFKKEHALCYEEKIDIRAQLTFFDDHFWIKDSALVYMFWWKIK